MFPRPRPRTVLLELAVWAAAAVINVVLIQGYSERVDWRYVAVSGALCLFVFYINYRMLIPLLMRRRGGWMLLYAALSLGLSGGSFYCVKQAATRFAQQHLDRLWEQEQRYDEELIDSVSDKNRLRERQRGIERQRRQPPEEQNREDERTTPRQQPDSAALARRRHRQDSILAISVVYTPREEEYRLLRRERRQAEDYRRRLDPMPREHDEQQPSENIWVADNPLAQHNLPFVFALFFFYMASVAAFFAGQSVRSERRRREIEQEKTSAELAYLKQQINPHFLFNTLNAIYSYTIGVSNEASDAVLKLSSILRYMLYETNRDRVPLADELAVIDHYIDLQRLRTTEKTRIDVVVRGDTRPHRIEPMLLIPIIENAFKYGVDSVELSFVHIEIEVEGHDFLFHVTNRIVRRNEGDANHSGIGLKNIRRRLELIYKPGHHAMHVQEKNGIFSVTLRLNLKD